MILNDFFASVFTGKYSSHTNEVEKGKGRDWEDEEPPIVRKKSVLRTSKEPEGAQTCGDLMRSIHAFGGNCWMKWLNHYPLYLRSCEVEKSGEVSADWKRENITCICKKEKMEDPVNYSPVSLISAQDVMEQILQKQC